MDTALGHLERGLIGHSGLGPVLFSNFITSSTAFRIWKGRLAYRDYKLPILTHPHLDRLQEQTLACIFEFRVRLFYRKGR